MTKSTNAAPRRLKRLIGHDSPLAVDDGRQSAPADLLIMRMFRLGLSRLYYGHESFWLRQQLSLCFETAKISADLLTEPLYRDLRDCCREADLSERDQFRRSHS